MIIKRLLYSVLALFPFIALAGNGFVIKGNISGVKNGTVTIMDAIKENITCENVRINNGEFVFEGAVEHPVLAKLKISTRYINVFLENTSYTISGALNELTGSSLKGGRANDDWQQYTEGNLTGSDYMQAHPNSIASAYLAFLQATDSYNEAQKGYDYLSPEARKSWYGRQLKLQLDDYKKTGVGADFPVLILHKPDGSVFAMKDMAGKIAVLDFWASWCAPCRAYIPTLREHYNKYKNKGVEFVSLSIDDDADKWKEAMAAEKMEWKQALVDGAFSAVQKALNIYHIPYMIVIGRDGKIAASLDYSKKDQLETILNNLLH